MRAFISGIVATVLAAGISFSASAQTREDAYIAARDAAVAKIKAAADTEKRGPMDGYSDKILAAEAKAQAELEKQMRAIIGPVVIKGMTGEAKLNLDTLTEGDEGFGILDGMVYGGLDAKTRVIVTTDSLFRRWLMQHKEWWGKDSNDIPQEPSAAVKENNFYTQAVLTDSAILRFADLPIRKPAGAAFAYAMLASRTQDDVPHKADEIFIAVAQGGKVFIANTKEFGAVGPIAVCDAIRSDFIKKSIAAAKEEGLDDKARREKSDDLSGKSDSEFPRCFADNASQQNSFAAAARAAQALLDRLPTR
jgi:hypothetical protein